MSIRVMADVWDFGPDDPTDNVVLLWLANRSNDQGGNCFPSRSEIATKVRHSERTVQRSLGRLEEEGWIAVKRGDGRGNFSQYQVNVERLKGRHRDSLLEEKGRHDDTLRLGERETFETLKGDKSAKPPTPPLIEEPSGTIILSRAKKPRERTKTDLVDARHTEFKAAIFAWWKYANGEGAEPDWNGAEGKQLGMWLGSSPKTTVKQFKIMLRNRGESDGIALTERPSLWLHSISRYAGGKLDRYGKAPNGANVNGQPKPKIYSPAAELMRETR
jgi:hypothetical protein